MRRAAIILTTLAALTAGGVASGQDDPYAQALRASGISPTKESLGEYLLHLVPGDDNRQRAKDLVQQLGHNDYHRREAAQSTLSSMPDPPLGELQLATESDDPEVRYRARQILAKVERGTAGHAGNAVVGYILHHRIEGLVQPLLLYLPHSSDTSPQGLTARAIKRTATKEDLDLLREAVRGESATVSAAAIFALAEVLGEQAEADLAGLLDHEQPLVRLAAAESLANLGRRKALAPLVKLLDVADAKVRARSAEVLRNFTRQRFQFVAYDKPEDRAAAAKRWRLWVIEHGAKAELYFPLGDFDVFLGRTLMSLYPNKLREIDAEGNELLETDGFQYVWGCHGTADGHRVVADFSRRYLIEYDAAGEVVLRLTDLPGPPADARRLESGNFLLALAERNKVVEVNREGKVIWSVDLAGRPTTANRLDNGNTVVNLQFAKKVVEIDPAGAVVWELTGLDNALTAQALSNGNVLVCEMGRGEVVEYDREGNKVWRKTGFNNACQAQRLPGGNTLVSDERGLHEFNPDGVEVWKLKVPRGRFWRY